MRQQNYSHFGETPNVMLWAASFLPTNRFSTTYLSRVVNSSVSRMVALTLKLASVCFAKMFAK
ncbi:uncharacterized protein PHALS_06050 [Plasmopara halstedii]|uniref:Uncharacterized protein n=1 Tax=Plasmopara halstedii TaxID=4781 RepID=A0A0P1ACQ6_PLAHL|nr:uncharacterized protein PHALS_06050 [Plasmopara halstedii]CEG38008.1 hypothetical protein PHALS_06050 [Plasmopara halstedii]|eukprot:XP_024574377.1 hypothetical protein PHALS_06050 [Plasmopara halstedii]